MSNSGLVNYTKISPNRTSPRRNKIDRITIHHMAGNLAVETCGNVFAPRSRQASSNYGIGSDGRVGMYVEEKDRAWTSSSGANDHRAITIEVADNAGAPGWGSSSAAMAKLILLCADICRRNGIKKLNYTGDTKGNMTLHKWFASTDCPGAYLESQMPTIASEVNKLLASGATTYTWKGATATGGSVPASSGKVTSNGKIAVDGSWGIATTKKAQAVFGTVQDGIISGQPISNKKYLANAYTGSWQFVSGRATGSNLIRAIQRRIGAAADGYFGRKSVMKFQSWLGVSVDGSMGPATVKAFQNWLNKQ